MHLIRQVSIPIYMNIHCFLRELEFSGAPAYPTHINLLNAHFNPYVLSLAASCSFFYSLSILL